MMSLILLLVNSQHACNWRVRGGIVKEDTGWSVGAGSQHAMRRKVIGHKNNWEEAVLLSKRNERRWLHISGHPGIKKNMCSML